MGPDPTDSMLVERALEGDKEAFGLLAERYLRMISVLAYQKTRHRSDAEDIVQEAFVRAFRALPSLREPARFAAWLYHITLKLCIDWSRRRERRDHHLSLDEEGVVQTISARLRRFQPKVGEGLERAEEHQRILAEVARLSDKYRLVMTLRFVQKMSYKEIAEHLAEPPGTVANRLHRAMRMVQERLGLQQKPAEGER